MSSEIAIKVENLSKCYQIYDQPHDRLKQFILPRLQGIAGQLPKQYYKEFWALKDVSFEIKKGETVGIIGRNGSGKSTLLQMICGTLNPTGGSIETKGRIAALLELGSGFNPEFTGRENIYLNASVLGLTRVETDAQFDNIVAFADIGDFIEQAVKTYSSGMMVRLAFAVIAHVDADILIVDEALSVGDAVFVQKCNKFLRGFLQKGTLFFVSHSMQAILELCDRAIWLDEGIARMDDDAKEVVRFYNAYVHQQINSAKEIYIQNRKSSQALTPPLTKKVIPPFHAKVFSFDQKAPYWGAGGAEILAIDVLNIKGKKIDTLEGGESIVIRISCRSIHELINPIVGFSLRNKRGVDIISDNTHNAGGESPLTIAANTIFNAEFGFLLPYLQGGEYFLGGAIADRPTGGAHLQHHRRDDAVQISVVSSHVVYGVFSMPMDRCDVQVN
jgi:lipopolysaccharide transport system ATP-binding protein